MPERGIISKEWFPIASKFPATLVKDNAPETLTDGQTPDAYGLGLDKPGYLYYQASPSSGDTWDGSRSCSAPTYAPDTCVWQYAHNRLWGYVTAGSTKLYYGDCGYDTEYYIKGLGYVDCNQESSYITNVIPFGGNVAVFKSDHLYIIANADNPENSFAASFVKQAVGLPVAANALAIDNVLVWANTHGVFATDDGRNIIELTMPVRSSLTPFYSTAITSMMADFEKKRVVGYTTSTQFIIELKNEPQLFDYSTSGFRFTTRTIVAEDAQPLVVDQIALVYQYSASEKASVNVEVKINDTWKSESTTRITPAINNGIAIIPLENVFACRKYALRLSNISPSLYINNILIKIKQGGVLGYSSK
ncbi:MAG: hypothetical protein PHW65_00045 [Dehalococcoidales bacterium]|nr:hypothetical protein [Dehalococcoidales bacterium]